MLLGLCTAVLAIPAQDRYIQACTLYLAYIGYVHTPYTGLHTLYVHIPRIQGVSLDIGPEQPWPGLAMYILQYTLSAHAI